MGLFCGCNPNLHMKNLLIKTITAVALVVLASCGVDKEFRIDGRVDGFGTGNLRLVYYNGDGVQSIAATAVDGRFMVSGKLNRPAMMRVYTNNGAIVGRLIIEPGETVDAVFNLTDPLNIKLDGNEDSERYAKFITGNADVIRSGNKAAINAAVDKYVSANPQRAVSGLLMADYYDSNGYEDRAMELINQLGRDARNTAALDGLRDMLQMLSYPIDSLCLTPLRLFGPGDSLSTVDPAKASLTVICLTTADNRGADSVAAAIDLIRNGKRNGKVQIADISCDLDTAAWKQSLRQLADNGKTSTSVSRYWTPSAYNIEAFEKMPVRRVPWFIVADSTGRVLYRGSSVAAARKTARQ